MSGSIKLKNAPFWIDVTCTKCSRRGRLKRENLLKKYPPDMAMPDLRWKLAEPCPRLANPFGNDPCGVSYVVNTEPE